MEEFVLEQLELEPLQEQKPVVEEQEEEGNVQERMRLRPHNCHPPGCGTKGHKIVRPINQHYRSLR